MENIFNRLQFIKHEEIFATREDAYNYIINKTAFERPSLLAEPMVLLYESGDEYKGPNVILAIGSTNAGDNLSKGRTFFIDTKKTEEEISEIEVQIDELFRILTFIPLESDTMNVFTEKTDNGTIISGDVKVADYRITSGKVENNIIQVEENKGLYAFVDMDYDSNNFVIKFNVNGVIKEFQLPVDQHVTNGWYSTDDEAIFLKLADGSKVKIDVVKLIDEWTVLGNTSSTPITLFKEHVSSYTDSHDGIYDWQDILTADIRVADHINDNILQKDGTGRYLYVKGTADNVKYKNGQTVADALDNIDTRVSTSAGNLIYKRPDGLYASAMLDYNSAENKLIYRYTDNQTQEFKEVSFVLNSVKILQDITYDPVREVIVIRYIDAQGEYQKVEIPAKDIIEEWIVNNEAHNIELVKYRSAGEGKDILSADAKIYTGDNNILVDRDHKLYVNGISDNIKYNITGNTTVKDALDTLSGETIVINGKLEAEIERAKDAEKELEYTIGTGFTDDPHDNITFKFESLSGKLDSEIERATDVETELQAAIEAEGQRAQDAETALNEKIDAETERATNAEAVLEGRVDTIEEEIGDGFGPRNTIRDEFDREKAEREAADAFLSGTIETLSANIDGRLKSVTSNDNSIIVDNTDPVNPDLSVNLSAEIEDEKPNIIKLNADGLYVGVDLSYSAASNTLIFKTTNGSKTIQLDSISSIISIEYIPSLEVIRITYIANGHEVKTTDVPVGDLINEWRVEDGHPHAVQLEKVRIASGTSEQDILKASVIITDDHDDNILVMDDGALYVSGAQISANTAAIEAEAARAQAAEDALDGRLTIAEADIDKLESDVTNEIVRATSAETALQFSINNEISRSTSEEARLEHAIDDEANVRYNADNTLQNSINSEVARAGESENRIETALNNEISRAQTKEGELNTSITNETLRAQAADNELYHDLSNESAARISGDVNLESAINQESSRAQVAETSISERLVAEISRSTLEDQTIRGLLATETTERQEGDIALQNAINAATITFDDTSSIDFTKTVGNIVTADVKLQEGDNIIKLGQGLYASVNLSYDPGTNKIKLVTSNGDGPEIQLVGASLLENIEYDSINKELVITYKDATGVEHTVRFGVSELFNDWDVNNPSENSAIELTKIHSTESGGEDKLSGRVILSQLSDNLITIDSNGLYASRKPIDDLEEQIQDISDYLEESLGVTDSNTLHLERDTHNVLSGNVKVSLDETNLIKIDNVNHGLIFNGNIDCGEY